MAAFAAEAADDKPRALMTAAPRCCTVGMNSDSSHCWSLPTASNAGLPLTSAWNTSGYCVAEWFPQIVIFVMSVVWTPAFFGELRHRPVVVEARHGRELAGVEVLGVLLSDETVGVGRVTDDEHPYIALR